ncbi:hypothetical protein E3T55_11480 [Cryobacterium frigoriphilum]|uniref:Uncharacterized protein n=1 Tax=Cryobacterium frigoriphilum TaxID=1259150 RepID=A0A4R8ZZD1_9MICO|nr:hypothetical protein [Cryobacterium frigoriphilum]TFD49386.1 hypothetical protein E3T55_11480 [Cryobacterium frigoriphilum]
MIPPGYHEDPSVIQLHRAIGGYITTFSEMTALMRQMIGEYLAPVDDEFPRPNPLLNIVFATMTAKPISDSFFAMATAVGDLDETGGRIRNALKREVTHNISFRNDLAHADWSLGWVNADTNEPLPSAAYKIKSDEGVPRLTQLDLGTNDVIRQINRLNPLRTVLAAFAGTCRGIQRGESTSVADVLELHRSHPSETFEVRKR